MSHTRSTACFMPLAAIAMMVTLAGGSMAMARAHRPAPLQAPAAASWPPSTDLLVSEVVTGGGSAADEWIELYDKGPLAADLGGLEVVYASATGTTATRKATWSGQVLHPGQHLMLANASGAYANLADITYSGGRRNRGVAGRRRRRDRLPVVGHGRECVHGGLAGCRATVRRLHRAAAWRCRRQRS